MSNSQVLITTAGMSVSRRHQIHFFFVPSKIKTVKDQGLKNNIWNRKCIKNSQRRFSNMLLLKTVKHAFSSLHGAALALLFHKILNVWVLVCLNSSNQSFTVNIFMFMPVRDTECVEEMTDVLWRCKVHVY